MHQLRKLQEGVEKSIKQRTPGGRKQHVKASKELQRKRSVKWNILSDVKHTITHIALHYKNKKMAKKEFKIM